MKNRKAPGADAISAEVLKAGGDEMTKFLLMLFNKVWREKNPPLRWSKMIVHLSTRKVIKQIHQIIEQSHCYQYLIKYLATYFSKE